MAAHTDVSKDVEAKGGMAIEAAMFLGITAFFVLAADHLRDLRRGEGAGRASSACSCPPVSR